MRNYAGNRTSQLMLTYRGRGRKVAVKILPKQLRLRRVELPCDGGMTNVRGKHRGTAAMKEAVTSLSGGFVVHANLEGFQELDVFARNLNAGALADLVTVDDIAIAVLVKTYRYF